MGQEPWPCCQMGLAQEGPRHPCHIPGDQEWSCRERSQLSACLLTNISVFPITGDSDPFAAGGSSSPLCSFPIFSYFSRILLLHPLFSSPQLSVVMPNPAASPLAHPRPRSPTKPGVVQPTRAGCSSVRIPLWGDTQRDERCRPPPHPWASTPFLSRDLGAGGADFASASLAGAVKRAGEGSLANVLRLRSLIPPHQYCIIVSIPI